MPSASMKASPSMSVMTSDTLPVLFGSVWVCVYVQVWGVEACERMRTRTRTSKPNHSRASLPQLFWRRRVPVMRWQTNLTMLEPMRRPSSMALAMVSNLLDEGGGGLV
jgi:hypothetical protein